MPKLRLSVLGAASLAVALLATSALGRGERRRPQLSIETVYLTHAVAGAHRVRLVAPLGGTGSLTLDPNTCTVNEFGDIGACTRMAARSIEVDMRQAKLADPLGVGRRLYRLVGDLPEGTVWHVVVPRHQGLPYRLLVDLGRRVRRIITMEPLARPVPPPKPKLGLCMHAAFRAERKGNKIVLYAKGEHPAGGYKTHFEKLPIEIFPPHFRLVCEPPSGDAPAVMSPFAVETSFDAGGTAVRAVVVYDARGKHTVPVP